MTDTPSDAETQTLALALARRGAAVIKPHDLRPASLKPDRLERCGIGAQR
jgi:hypothetical protein